MDALIHKFGIWFSQLGWSDGSCFAIAAVLSFMILLMLIDRLLAKVSAWRERRAIRERNWIMRQQRVQLIIDAQREKEQRDDQERAQRETAAKRLAVRVWRDRVQTNRESKQFHVQPAFRDMKGTHR
jgi:hypothetical protein